MLNHAQEVLTGNKKDAELFYQRGAAARNELKLASKKPLGKCQSTPASSSCTCLSAPSRPFAVACTLIHEPLPKTHTVLNMSPGNIAVALALPKG